jgi:hypothetical protein
MRFVLDRRRHPFWQHARGEFFLARRAGCTVGRISAQVDFSHLDRWHDHTGSFGFFECIDDDAVACALFDTAAAWLRARGITRMRGPYSPSINAECGFLAEGFDTLPAIGMAYSPHYYLDLAREARLSPVKNLWAFELDRSVPTPPVVHAVARRLEHDPHFSVRAFDMSHLEHEAALVADIFNECWKDNWGFAPITHAEMTVIVREVRPFASMAVVLFACYDGEPIGISVVLPDLNQLLCRVNGRIGLVDMLRLPALRRGITRCRCVIAGIRPAFRRRGVDAMLYGATESFVRQRYRSIECSWVLEENSPTNQWLHRVGAVPVRRYCIMERPV